MVVEVLKISLIASIFSFAGEPEMIFWRYRKQIMKFPTWINKPLGSCHLCISGQACFWFYLIAYFEKYQLASLNFIDIMNLSEFIFALKSFGLVCIDHLFFTCAGIFLSSIYASIYYYDTN